MARFLSLAFAFISLLMISACGGGDSHEKLAKESVSTMNQFGATLAKITDKASAEKQVKELERISTKMNDIQVRMEKLGEPSEKDAKRLETELQTEMGAAMASMMKETTRLAMMPEVMAVIEPTLSKMGS